MEPKQNTEPGPVNPESFQPPTQPLNETGVSPVLPDAIPSPAPLPNPVIVPPPAVTVGGGFEPGANPVFAAPNPAAAPPVPPASKGPRWWKSKRFLVPVVATLLILGGAAAYYFGYYMNPSLIYSQSLKNTGKGYDKLIDYIDTQSQSKNKSYTGNGSYAYKSADFSTDGRVAFKADGTNGELTFDVGAGITRVNTEIRAIKSSGTTPDVYIKASGIKGLGAFTGSPEIDAAVNKLDNTWVLIDHSLIDTIANSAAGEEVKSPSREEAMDALRAFSEVNQDYVFTADKDKSVTTVVKNHGVETVAGHKVYRYTATLQKENVKKYIDAQREALKGSKLGAWLKKNKYDKTTYAEFDNAKKSANKIKSSYTFDVWMDVDKRIIYKVRLPDEKDSANNYADIGLDYKGGDSYPFFISGRGKEDGQLTTGSLVATLNTKTNVMTFKMNVKADGRYGGTLTGDFTYRPGVKNIKIEKPAGAKTLAQVMSEMGLAELYNSYLQAASASVNAIPTSAL